MKIALCQINPTVGDLEKNFELIRKNYQKALDQSCDLAVFSECVLTGYPPKDLLLKKYFLDEIANFAQKIVDFTASKNCAILFGLPIFIDGELKNGAILAKNGEILQKIAKKNLPNYGVFDEKRYFNAAKNLSFIEFCGKKIAILICEDLWVMENVNEARAQNPDFIISINASPFEIGKNAKRQEVARKFGKKIIYLNQIGGVDHLIFDGNSFVLDENGEKILQMKKFEEDFAIFDENCGDFAILSPENDEIGEIYHAIVLGIRDYFKKTGFQKAILGLSGGIDSALVAVLAVDALGSENVELFALPSKFNSKESFDDAYNLAKNLGIELKTIEIEEIFAKFNEKLSPVFAGKSADLTEENLQSRIRGVLLMALSNKFGSLLLSTGNKSELAVGYATIYGDMNGAFNPLKDVYKTQVFALARWRNLGRNLGRNSDFLPCFCDENVDLIPNSIITKEPSAELRHNQKDRDSLPEYEILDAILFLMIEDDKSVEEIVKLTNFDENLVKKVAKLFYQSEYKRKQAVLGPKISTKSFDEDRRYLISNKFQK